jgi:hydroxymethylpyrimidine/phosphomethylpyrimidine kinase
MSEQIDVKEQIDAILLISALDPSGGAGIIADTKTAHSLGFYPCPVLTAITYQNTCRISGIFRLDEEIVNRQISPILEDVSSVKCAKVGACAKKSYLKEVEVTVVYDPVIRATVGYPMTELKDVVEVASVSDVITPNAEEAKEICGFLGHKCMSIEEACEMIYDELGCRVVITGVVDVAYDGRKTKSFEGTHTGVDIHGTGCVFSTALACYLTGNNFFESVKKAKEFVIKASLRALNAGKCRKIVNP